MSTIYWQEQTLLKSNQPLTRTSSTAVERRIRFEKVAEQLQHSSGQHSHRPPGETPYKVSDRGSHSSISQIIGSGMEYHNDTLSISVGATQDIIPTKRGAVSDLAQTFDVLGWFSPSTVTMKTLFQRLWELKLSWDEVIPPDLIACGRSSSASSKRNISITVTTAIHLVESPPSLFSDASENANAAVVYLRATYEDSPPTLTLVTAKTKVAPLKKSSIPRLELCGASLLAKLLTSTRLALNISLTDLFAWCDSTIVLHWLDGSP